MLKRTLSLLLAACIMLPLAVVSCTKPGPGPNPDPDPDPDPEPDTYTGTKVDNLISATYLGVGVSGAAEYNMAFSTGEVDGDLSPVKAGATLFLDLYGPESADPVNAELPVGTYKPGEKAEWTFSQNYTYVVIKKTDDSAPEMDLVLGGTINVEKDDSGYTILAELTLLTNGEQSFRYKGNITFIEGESTSFERFKDPVDIEMTDGVMRYYGNWQYPHADDATLQLFNGEFDESMNLISGYYLNFMFFMNKKQDGNIEIPDGVYSLSDKEIPFTFIDGQLTDFWGELYATGTHLQYLDPETGKSKYGFIKGGTMTATTTGDTQELVFDLVSEEGVSIKCTFKNELEIKDFSSNPPYEPKSTLTADKELDLEGATGTLYYGADNWKEGLDSWILKIDNPESDAIMVEFMTESVTDGRLPEGEYTISLGIEPNHIIPGFMTANGTMQYSWWLDNSTMSGEYYNDYAPLMDGTMTVSKSGDEYTITFEMKDDAETPHRVYGTWTGLFSAAEGNAVMMAVR